MSRPVVRMFRRDDREQVTTLVNAHVGAVVPGWAVSVQTVMAQIERDPGEWIVDPWVTERSTLVAVERERVVAAAHLCRYGRDDRVDEWFRDAGEIKWFVCWPAAVDAGRALLAACSAQLELWAVRHQHAGVQLPTPVTYGVSDCWPHIRALFLDDGFVHVGKVEIVTSADVEDLARTVAAPAVGMRVRREVGESAVRFVAVTETGEVAGWFHVQADLTAGGVLTRLEGWGSVWELGVGAEWRRRGVASWLVSEAARVLLRGQVRQLIDQAWPDEHDRLGFFEARGFHELTRIENGWSRR